MRLQSAFLFTRTVLSNGADSARKINRGEHLLASSIGIAFFVVIAELGACGHVEIIPAEASGSVRGEVESLAVGGKVRSPLVGKGIGGGAEIQRRGPRIMSRWPRGDPQVEATDRT